ncbi:MAG TPA: cell division protein FtsA [Proteobacteria bacterium]|nr:cell division protein FtsA [bacterium BMS3Abin14]HDL53606.1 cell division protein FtsA [Pseudomonadota bacterium]
MAKGRERIVVGLDVGTTKICIVVTAVDEKGWCEIIGIGTTPSKGLRKGVVINIDATVDSIKKAVEEAELMAGVPIQGAYVGIAGGHIKGFNSHGVVAVKTREVTKKDIERVIDAAQAVAMPLDREIIHTLTQEFIVDDQDGIVDPLGMSGVRLEAKVHIVTGAVTSAQNIIKSSNRAGLDVLDIVLEPLAAASAVLTDEEKELGVALVDIGGGTTDLAIFGAGSIRQTAVLALGGINLTNDVAYGLRSPATEAERIKKEYGCALTEMVGEDEEIEVMGVGGHKPRKVSRRFLSEIIEPRAEEFFELINREILKSGHNDRIASGIVLTGGTVIMSGMAELAEQVFNMPVRVGYPRDVGGLVDVVKSPMYATGVGLIKYGATHGGEGVFGTNESRIFDKILAKMRDWLKDFI